MRSTKQRTVSSRCSFYSPSLPKMPVTSSIRDECGYHLHRNSRRSACHYTSSGIRQAIGLYAPQRCSCLSPPTLAPFLHLRIAPISAAFMRRFLHFFWAVSLGLIFCLVPMCGAYSV